MFFKNFYKKTFKNVFYIYGPRNVTDFSSVLFVALYTPELNKICNMIKQ